MFRCRHRCRPHLLCPSPAAPRMGHAAFAERHSRRRRRAPHLPPRCALRAPTCPAGPEDVPSRLSSTIPSTRSRAVPDPPPRQQLVAPSYEAMSRALDLGLASGAACTLHRGLLHVSFVVADQRARQAAFKAPQRPLGVRPDARCCRWPPHNHKTKVSRPEWYEPSGFSPSTCLIERRGAALIQRTETSKPFLRNGLFCFFLQMWSVSPVEGI
jgi:hypothetical protein